MGKPGAKGKGGKKGYLAPRQNKSVGKEKKTEEKVKCNPFEIQVNKRKLITLGRIGREEHGHPGLAKSRGIIKRKKTLLKAYLTRNKTNSLEDRRIGERNSTLPEEDKIVRRSAAEKKKQYKKKSIFNLNDDEDEVLTHKGQSLDAAGRYEDPRDSSDSEDERLNEAFVGEANFGGSFLRRKAVDGNASSLLEPEKTRDQVIAELILASKVKKHEKSTAEAAMYEQICKLDEDLKQTKKFLWEHGNKVQIGTTLESSVDDIKSDYDRSLKLLQFEKRAQASERLKTEEEIQEEVDQLRRLNEEECTSYLKDPTLITMMKVFKNTDCSTFEETNKALKLLDNVEYMIKVRNSQTKEGSNPSIYLPELFGFFSRLMTYIYDHGRQNANNEDVPLCTIWKDQVNDPYALVESFVDSMGSLIKEYKRFESAFEIFEPMKIALEGIKDLHALHKTKVVVSETYTRHRCPSELSFLAAVDRKIKEIEALRKKEIQHLETKKDKPTMLRLYEPDLTWDPTAPGKRSKSSRNEGRLAAKVKKETKGAIRELKKDNAFLGNQQRKEQAQSDAERNQKVKALMSSLANQEGDYQKFKKTK